MWAWQAFYLGGSFQERQGLGLGEQGEGAARGASGLKGADARAQSEQEDDKEVHIELVEWLRLLRFGKCQDFFKKYRQSGPQAGTGYLKISIH